MTKNKKIFSIICISIICAGFLIAPVFAQTEKVLDNPLGTADPQQLIGRIIQAVLGIVGSIALLMFIYGGFLWLTSGGNEQKIAKGKNVLVWAIIGLAIIFLSYTLVNFVIKGLTGGTPGSSGTSSGVSGTECCYSQCTNGQISNPSMVDKGTCTTKWVQPLSGGSCSPIITVGDCN